MEAEDSKPNVPTQRKKAKGREKLRNLGPVSMRWLEAVGVRDRNDLERLGAAEVYVRVRDLGFVPSRNLLWALQGAILDVHWADLPDTMKARLDAEVAAAIASDD